MFGHFRPGSGHDYRRHPFGIRGQHADHDMKEVHLAGREDLAEWLLALPAGLGRDGLSRDQSFSAAMVRS